MTAAIGLLLVGAAWSDLSGAPVAPAGVPGVGADGLAAVPEGAGAAGMVDNAMAPPDGQQLYLQTCASCHGPDGRGTAFGPSLETAGTASLDFYLRTGRMPLSAPSDPQWRQQPIFDEAQIAAITKYASRFGEGPDIPQVTSTGDLRRGAELFINDCAACHGPSGSGGAIGGGVFAPDLSRADTRIVAEAIVVGPGAMPAFAFPEEDLAAIAAYVQHLRAQPSPGGLSLGGFGPVPEGFVAVVIGLGLVVLVTRWIARKSPA